MAYAVFRSDLMRGTIDGTALASAKYFVGATETEIENGNVVALDSLMPGEREIWKAVAPEGTETLGAIAVVGTPEVMYDERKRNLDDFINEVGTPFRAYILNKGDIFGVTKEALDGAETPKVGDIVELKAGTKLNVVTTATDGSTTIGKVIAVETDDYTYYVIKVA